MTGGDDDGKLDSLAAQLLQQLEAGHLRHAHVGDQTASLERRKTGKEGRRRSVDPDEGMPAALKRKASDWRTASSSSDDVGQRNYLASRPLISLDGSSVKRNRVPPPGFGSAHSSPPWASTMRLEMERPTPMPAGWWWRKAETGAARSPRQGRYPCRRPLTSTMP